MVKKHIKIFPTSLDSRETRNKTIMRYHYLLTTWRWTFKRLAIPSVDQDVKQLQLWYIGGNVKCFNHFERSLVVSQVKCILIIWSSISTQRYFPKRKIYVNTKPSTKIFIATMFKIVKNGNQSLSTDEWVKKLWHVV